MVGPPAMVGRRPAKIPPAGTLGAPIPGPWVQAGVILYYIIGYILGYILVILLSILLNHIFSKKDIPQSPQTKNPNSGN